MRTAIKTPAKRRPPTGAARRARRPAPDREITLTAKLVRAVREHARVLSSENNEAALIEVFHHVNEARRALLSHYLLSGSGAPRTLPGGGVMTTGERRKVIAALERQIAGYRKAAREQGVPEPWIVAKLEAALTNARAALAPNGQGGAS